MSKSKELYAAYLGRIPYGDALEAQRALREAVVAGGAPGGLLLLEHPPTITVGRHGRGEHILTPLERLRSDGVEVHHIERGGDVTYHGPGQLVGYPVMPVVGGVQRFVRSLARAAQDTLASLGIESTWRDDQPGLWTAAGKIAAVGLHVGRGVAIHGIALNVHPLLDHYDYIVPCGLPGGGVTSVHALIGESPALADVARELAGRFHPGERGAPPRFVEPAELLRAQAVPRVEALLSPAAPAKS